MNEIQAVLFDLDGTIYVGDHLIDGAQEVVDYIRSQRKKVAFLTNNSTKTREQILKKLNSFGIKAELNDIYTSAFSTAQYLAEKQITNVYCLGTESFEQELSLQKIEIVKEASANCVVIGMTNEIKHEQLMVIREIAAKPNSLFIACNVDGSYPDGSGQQASGCGKVVEIVEQTISRKVDLVIGKPFPFMIDTVARDSQIAKEQMMIVGDSLDSDIELAKRNACIPVLLGDFSLQHEDCIVIESLEKIKTLLELPSSIHKLMMAKSELHLTDSIMNPYRTIFEELKQIYIFGAQQLGAKIYEQCQAAGIEILGFIDNDPQKQGKSFMGTLVLPLEECDLNSNIVIASTTYLGEIHSQLLYENYSNIIPFTVLNLLNPVIFKNEPVFIDMHKDLFDNRFKYVSLFLNLKEEKSKKTLADILKSRMDFRFHELEYTCENHYFDDDIVVLDKGEVFVDGGGYSGDTAEAFIQKTEGQYKGIYLFEPDTGLLEQARTNLSDFSNILYFNKGLSSEKKKVSFNQTGGLDGSISLDGLQTIEVIALDEEVSVPITFIKLDIEGAEEEALKGAAHHLQEHHPKLAIACYHKANDLWKLPATIMDLAEGYEFYFRHYSKSALETVLYAIKRR